MQDECFAQNALVSLSKFAQIKFSFVDTADTRKINKKELKPFPIITITLVDLL